MVFADKWDLGKLIISRPEQKKKKKKKKKKPQNTTRFSSGKNKMTSNGESEIKEEWNSIRRMCW